MTTDRPLDRRRLLKGALGLAAAAALPRCTSPRPMATPRSGPADRLVLLRLGGGARGRDLFTDDRNSSLAPALWSLTQDGALATNVRNEGSTGHRTATRVLLTGRGGGAPSDPNHLAGLRRFPTLFELWRAARGRPLEAAFAAGLPESSDADGFGRGAGALAYLSEHVPLPGRSISGDPTLGPCPHVSVSNQLLGRVVAQLDESTIPVGGPTRRRRLREQVEAVVPAAMKAGELGQLSIDALTDRMMIGRPYIRAEEADDWLVELSLRAMRALKPEVIGIGCSTTDLAHRGAWSTYAAQVRRIDIQLGRIVRFLEEEPFYRGRTLVLVTTDCGRGDERFDRHEADDEGARTTFLAAFGAGAARGRRLDTTHSQVDVAATAARGLGFDLPDADGRPIEGLLA